MIDHNTRAAGLLTLGFAGMVGLITIEILRGMTAVDDPSIALALAIMLAIAATPVLLLLSVRARWSFWVAFAIATLLSLFHAVHIAEHATDIPLLILIVFTMFAPSVLAAAILWRHRHADQPVETVE